MVLAVRAVETSFALVCPLIFWICMIVAAAAVWAFAYKAIPFIL